MSEKIWGVFKCQWKKLIIDIALEYWLSLLGSCYNEEPFVIDMIE